MIREFPLHKPLQRGSPHPGSCPRAWAFGLTEPSVASSNHRYGTPVTLQNSILSLLTQWMFGSGNSCAALCLFPFPRTGKEGVNSSPSVVWVLNESGHLVPQTLCHQQKSTTSLVPWEPYDSRLLAHLLWGCNLESYQFICREMLAGKLLVRLQGGSFIKTLSLSRK